MSNKLEQLEFKLEIKILGFRNMQKKLEKRSLLKKSTNGCQKVRFTKGRDLTNIYLFWIRCHAKPYITELYFFNLAIWGVKTKRLQKKTEAEGMSKWVDRIFKVALHSSYDTFLMCLRFYMIKQKKYIIIPCVLY